jgi:hypothetical protein
VDGVPYVPHTKVTDELCIPIGKVTDKMLRWSDTGECVLRLLHITQIQHLYLISSRK